MGEFAFLMTRVARVPRSGCVLIVSDLGDAKDRPGTGTAGGGLVERDARVHLAEADVADVQLLRTPLRRGILFRAAQIYAERFADGDGRIRATFEIVWLAGWAPHASQQKPLAPGSAKQRLADALGTKELPLPGDGKPPSSEGG